ncbi:hypothetical protein ACIHDR_16900 [Nocardia sp. NPDC052278]|uniref:hypothetical protein n=1 Tax=unclassified Nocardia TaxID=2637762 RepID=UPI0036CA26AF
MTALPEPVRRLAIAAPQRPLTIADYVDLRRSSSVCRDAGIPHYWIIDSTPPMSLLALSLTEELGYVDSGEVTETFTTTSQCPISIQLDKLG